MYCLLERIEFDEIYQESTTTPSNKGNRKQNVNKTASNDIAIAKTGYYYSDYYHLSYLVLIFSLQDQETT